MSGRGRGRGRGRSFGRGGRFFPNQSFVRKNNEAPITSSSNKWVRTATDAAATAIDQRPVDDSEADNVKEIDEDVKTEETITQSSSDVNPPENLLERRGKHKLVMKKDDDSSTLSNKKKLVTGDSGKFSWKRKSADSSQEPPTSAVQREINSTETISKPSHHNLKRKRSDKIPHGPRRICLSSTTAGEVKDADDQIVEQPTQKTLTDFQYNNISARGRGGRGRGKTMGLIRVKPKNPSDTPICPTFSRGLPCNNAKCTLRHDVATEASRPMCVFFQRNGMCSRGDDCPFKHVKISWDAEICPMFDKLGYCEDESCVLRHVASSKKSKPNNAIDKR
ncbi:hypothetical protein ACHAWC_006599 [Mediolabrus comicus]